jgi:hypothetical protein
MPWQKAPHPAAATGRQHAATESGQGADRGVNLNRALWVLAEEMRKLKR